MFYVCIKRKLILKVGFFFSSSKSILQLSLPRTLSSYSPTRVKSDSGVNVKSCLFQELCRHSWKGHATCVQSVTHKCVSSKVLQVVWTRETAVKRWMELDRKKERVLKLEKNSKPSVRAKNQN